MAGLRLDVADTAYDELKSGRHAIVPGDPSTSAILARVSAPNPAQRMPPRSTNKTLTQEQINTLTTWIRQGAKYKPHWAFIAAAKPTPPVIPGLRTTNEVDRFIGAKLAKQALAQSKEADKETLINRVTLILTGLPPTLAEVDDFLKDRRPGAYERVVDRLLASPAYGEHMASYWLDVARYSESDGFLDDLHDRMFWPYRDWVFSAFNKNMPFDQFVRWQVAGDLMPRATKEQRLATAFLRVGKRTTENGAIDEEYRVEYAIDRASTVGVGLLGMTVGCARCHDHKYDPISQKEFYSLTGFFNSTDEPGFYAPGRTGITSGPTLDWTDSAVASKLALADAAVQRDVAAYEKARRTAAAAAGNLATSLIASHSDLRSRIEESIKDGLEAYYPFDETAPIPDDKLPTSRDPNRRLSPPLLAPDTNARFAAPPVDPSAAAPAQEGAADPAQPPAGPGGNPGRRRAGPRGLPAALVRDALVWSPSTTAGAGPAVLESANLKPGVKGNAFFFDDTNRGFFASDVGDFERTQAFSLDFWLLAGHVYDQATVLTHREYDWFGNAGYQVELEKNRLRFELLHSRAGNRISIVAQQPIQSGGWTHVTLTYDGSSKAQGARIFLNGAPAQVEIESDNLTRTIVPNGGGALGDEYLGLSFGKRFRLTPMKDGALDEFRVFKTALTEIEIRYLQDPSTVSTSSDDLRRQIIDLLVARDAGVKHAAAKLREVRDEQNRIVSVIPEIPVMGDTPKPRPTYLLVRGQYDQHGDEVQPEGLSQIFKWKAAWPRNRLGLAEWLLDPENPLTSRVFVNRLWQQAFGRGLVDTSGDFGTQGSVPTHPELLDWLAVTFRETGWDTKRMLKLLVMSDTFRQSSDVSDDALKKDPRNVWLARFPRARMSAEMIRDNALAASGLLTRRIGGPSAYPYQPDGIWDGLSGYNYLDSQKVPADEHHRRTVYSFVKRNAPHPAMAVFDFPDRGSTTVKRQISNTPLQALVLLDDPQYLEAYRKIAETVLQGERDTDAQLTTVVRIATRRQPRPTELNIIRDYYTKQLSRYQNDSEAATALLTVGRAQPPSVSVDVARAAALMNVVAAVMNSPAAYTLR